MGRTNHLRPWLLATAAVIVCSAPALGQEAQPQDQNAQESATEGGLLDQITIIASKFDEEVIASLTSTSVVGKERLEQKQASDIGQVLNGVPGVATAGSQDHTGLGTSINIRGLQDFGRVAMITDGARNNFSRNDHGSAGSMWIEPELLKQVTVVRGPVANIYGSGAIGGVVVFETKSASDFLREGEQYGGSIKGGYETNGDGYLTSVTGAIKPAEAFDLLGNFTYRERDDYKGGDGDRVDDSSYEVQAGLAKAVIRPADGHEITLGWIGNRNDWEEPSTSMPQETDLREDIFTGKYRYVDPNSPWIDFTLSGYVNDTSMDQTALDDAYRWDQNGGGWVLVPEGSRRHFDLTTTGFDVNNVSRFDTGAIRHTLTYGGDWFEDDVDVEDPQGGANVYSPSGYREVWGAFVQDKLEFSDWLEVVGGLRYDSYRLESDDGEIDNKDDRLSPRVTVGVKPFETTGLQGLQIYGTYAEGYRSPSVIETLMAGNHPAGVVFPFLPNPNLVPETGHLYEVGLNYKRDGIFTADDGIRIKAAVFHNTINDYIGATFLSAFDPTSGCPFAVAPPPPPPDDPDGGGIPICYQYQNFEEVVIKGIEFEVVYDTGRYFAGLSGTFLESEDKATDTDLASVPPDTIFGYVGTRFADDRAVVGAELQYFFDADRTLFDPETGEEEDYHLDSVGLVNLFGGYAFTDDFRMDLRIENLFDVKQTNYLNDVMGVGDFLEPGFNAKISATWRFGG